MTSVHKANRYRCYTLLMLLFPLMAGAQKTVPFFGKINWISGYARDIRGEHISYFSAFPDYATTALLTRTTDGKKFIEWETAPVPQQVSGKYVYFSWVAAHSSGTSSGNRNFDLYLGEEKILTFTTLPAHQAPDWSFGANDSTRLVFQQTKRDGANDAHGLAYLRLPVSRVTPGKPVRLKIAGQAQQSNDWFMTFMFSFQEKVDVTPMPFILKNGKQPVVLTALHFGNPETLKVVVGQNNASYMFTVTDGISNFDIPVNPVQQKDSVLIKVSSGKKELVNRYVQLAPIVHRELHFIHHSHTDIGYSHLQPDVLKIHIKNIEDAMQLIEQTKTLPEEARFKWNIESLWAVENYLQQASPAQQAAFVAAVKSGSIVLSGLYANLLTGMSEPEEMFHYTEYAEQLRRQYGITINSAMISDIPGYAWSTVTALSKGGIKYFSSGPNYLGENHPYLGDRVGHFVRTWGDKPVWWVSPSGEEKILFWTAGKGYSSWHGTAPGAVFERGPKKIAAYLNELAASNYPYDIVQWRYNIVADNGPLDTSISRFVAAWNEKYASPKIILNTTDQLFEAFEQKYGSRLPVVKGDITPYWEDGAQSTAYEEGVNRANSLHLQQLATLYAMLAPQRYNAAGFYAAWKNILLFHEHTWGAYNSISQPDDFFVREQWRIKKQFMLDADMQVQALDSALWIPLTNNPSRRVMVINTASWKRSGLVTFPATVPGKSVKQSNGALVPLQQLSNGNYAFIATDIPPLGMETYTITDEVAPAAVSAVSLNGSTLSNGTITAGWDTTGSITTLTTTGNLNYAGTFNGQGLNSYWYVPGMDPSVAISNEPGKVAILENGPVITTVSMKAGNAPGAHLLEKRITLSAGSDVLLIENILDKKDIRTKEAVHFGFPFNPAFTTTLLDGGYGSYQYLSDQLPGSNLDYLYARSWIDVASADHGVQLMLLQSPLVEPGSMIDERQTINQSHKEWKKQGQPASTWFSYAMNNYWHTNYKAGQTGIAQFRYALRPHQGNDAVALEQAAMDFTQPLIAVTLNDSIPVHESLFELSDTGILVTSITPNENNSYLIRLFNPSATQKQTAINWKYLQPKSVMLVQNGAVLNTGDAIAIAGKGVVELFILTQ